jgi:outer membrane protein assembly factor BamB
MSCVQPPGKIAGLYFILPEGNIDSFGPLHYTLQDDGYKADGLYFHYKFRLSADQKQITGTLSFDGNELPFELKRGKLAATSPDADEGRVAQPTWTFMSGGPIWSSPAFADGDVYFGSDDGKLYALEAKSGKALWQFKTGGPVFGSPAVEGDAVYVLSDDGFLYKLDRTSGRTRWRFDTHGGGVKREAYDRLASRPAVVGDVVYIGSADDRLYALDAATGTEKWHAQARDTIRSSAAVADGRVFFGSSDGNVYAVDAGSGALLWQYDTFKPVVSSPLVSDGGVYIGSRNANFYAFDAATGRVKWRKFYWTSWVESSAHVRDGVIYVGSSDYEQLFALAAKDGRELWRFDTHGEAWPDPAVTDKFVYTGSVGYSSFPRRAGFYAVDRATGHAVWRYPMAATLPPLGGGVASSPVVGDGLVFFGGLDGVFYAFREDG